MDYSDSENAISTKWEELLNNTSELTTYIMNALMLTPFDTRRKIVDGKPQKAVQIFALQRSIENNADANKKGLTYLAMRSIHYWKTIYERAIQNPEEIEDKKGKYVSRNMYDSIIDDFHAEIEKLQDVMYSKNVVPKDEYETLEKECNQWRRKYETLDNDFNKNMEAIKLSERKYAQQDVLVLEKRIKFLEEELRKAYAKNSNDKH